MAATAQATNILWSTSLNAPRAQPPQRSLFLETATPGRYESALTGQPRKSIGITYPPYMSIAAVKVGALSDCPTPSYRPTYCRQQSRTGTAFDDLWP